MRNINTRLRVNITPSPKMEPTSHHLLRVSFSVVLLFSLQGITSYGAIIGAIVDLSSRVGKEEKVAMEMAIEDFQNRTNQSLVLQVKDSQGKPIHAAVAATRLIHKQHVQAILGPSTWEEASLVSEIGSHSHTPILSFANSPSWANTRWPYLIQASPPSQHTQMKAVASIIQSSGWRRVVVIYEDISSSVNGVIPHLHDSLDEVGSKISVLVGLPPIDSSSSSSSLYDELENLKRGQYRVIVVHVSLPLALRLFQQAKRMGMLEKEYVWITTDTTTSLVHAINSSYIASMQGVLGVKSYFNETEPDFHDFYLRFKRRFGSENPEEPNHEPGIFALQAYDATRAVALAMDEYIKNEDLLEKILSSNFDGLGGKVHFSTEKKLPLAKTFQIINVIGKSYKEIGFWSDGFGFSNSIGHERESYNASMENLGQVFWPGEARYTPKGWALPTNPKRFKVAVPNGTLFNLFLQVGYDKVTNTNTCNGFACDIFKETIAKLPYDFPYEFHIFGGTFNEMIDQVHLKNFDAAIGGIAITAARCKLVDFSQPHTDTSLVMIVPVQSEFSDKAWMFLKPFTNAMWLLTAGISVYNGFVVWMIERDHCSGLRGSVINQIRALLWLAFATLFSRQGDNLHSNLSRMATVVWLFVAIVIMQSYTANLASMLTIPRLEPTVADIETLKYTNAMVGCTKKSFVASYLTDVLLFSRDHLKNYSTPDEIALALRKREIAAVFIEAPWAKLFLTRYCKSFIAAGPTYKIGGYGFAFQKGSMMISDVNEALLNVTETGKLLKLETDVTATEKCVDVELDNNISLSPSSFWVLFILSGGTSTIALMVYMIHRKKTFQDSLNERETIWVLMVGVLKYWLLRKNQFSRKVSDVESPKSGSPPNGLKSWPSV